MNHQHLDLSDSFEPARRTTSHFGFLALSLCVGLVVWGTVFSLSLVSTGLESNDLAASAFGFKQQIADSRIIDRDSQLFLIEPAAGPE